MLRNILVAVIVSIAIYPIVFLGVWGLFFLGSLATSLDMPADAMPLVYGLAFAVATVAFIELLGVASVVMALISCANLIEYAQLIVPDRTPSVVDFLASLVGVVIAALLVWMARMILARFEPSIVAEPEGS